MKNFKTFKFLFIAVLLNSSLLISCASVQYNINEQPAESVPYPDASFAVITDLHVWDPALGSEEARFLAVLDGTSKQFLDSIPFLDNAIDKIIETGVSFVLVCGDLTKDGELHNHMILAEKLKRLTDAGIDVLVVPGNHDINSGKAVRYTEENTERVPNVSDIEFAGIYSGFGFNKALERDKGSLSYVTEPVEGLWILSIDSCRYREQSSTRPQITAGGLSQETVNWITSILTKAQNQNKAVIVMMHHRVVPYAGVSENNAANFLIRDYESFGNLLASWNVRVVFTGHSHAQTINRVDFRGRYLYDIQTGALVSSPAVVRFIEISDNVMSISSDPADNAFSAGESFMTNSNNFFRIAF